MNRSLFDVHFFRLLTSLAALTLAGMLVHAGVQKAQEEAVPKPAGWNKTALKREGRSPQGLAAVTEKGVALRVTLRPDGFDPAEARVAASRVVLFIDNGAFWNEKWTWRLETVTGKRLHQQPMERSRIEWAGQLQLTPGEYRLSVVERSEYVCRIYVDPSGKGYLME